MADYQKAKDIFIQRKRASGTFEEFPLIVQPNCVLATNGTNDLVMISTSSFSGGSSISASWASQSLSASHLVAITSSVQHLQVNKLTFLGASGTIQMETEAAEDNISITKGGLSISSFDTMIFSVDGVSGEVSGSTFRGNYFRGLADNASTASALLPTNNYTVNSLTVNNTLAQGNNAPSAQGSGSHAEGDATEAIGASSHAEGTSTFTTGFASHAEGDGCSAQALASHAEGGGSTATGADSHAEGIFSRTVGAASHAEGESCVSVGDASHAEGYGTTAIGQYSHTAGNSTIASGSYQNVLGRFNSQNNTESLFIVGNGQSHLNRSDILLVNSQSVVISGSEIIQPALSGSTITFNWVSGSIICPRVIVIRSRQYGSKTLTFDGVDTWYSPDFQSSISNLNPIYWVLNVQASVAVSASVSGYSPDDPRLRWGGLNWVTNGEYIPLDMSSSAVRNAITVPVGDITATKFIGTASYSMLGRSASYANTAGAALTANSADAAGFASVADTSNGPWSNSGTSLSSIDKQYFSPLVTATVNIDWNTSNVQDLTLANDVNIITLANGVAGGRYMLLLRQPASGNSGSVTWPDTGSVKWSGGTAPTLTVTNGKTDLVGFVFDGTIYYGSAALNF